MPFRCRTVKIGWSRELFAHVVVVRFVRQHCHCFLSCRCRRQNRNQKIRIRSGRRQCQIIVIVPMTGRYTTGYWTKQWMDDNDNRRSSAQTSIVVHARPPCRAMLPAKSSASLKQMSFFGIRAQNTHKTKILMSPNSSHADINNLVNI